jgi:DNA-directed RNA polymerase subunit M/transcription elongation factor TFIIS
VTGQPDFLENALEDCPKCGKGLEAVYGSLEGNVSHRIYRCRKCGVEFEQWGDIKKGAQLRPDEAYIVEEKRKSLYATLR